MRAPPGCSGPQDQRAGPLCAHAEQAEPVDPAQQALDTAHRPLANVVGKLPDPTTLGDNCRLERRHDRRHQRGLDVVIVFMLPWAEGKTQEPIGFSRETLLGHPHKAGFATAPVRENSDGKRPKVWLLREKDQGLNEAIDPEEIDVCFIVRPHRSICLLPDHHGMS